MVNIKVHSFMSSTIYFSTANTTKLQTIPNTLH